MTEIPTLAKRRLQAQVIKPIYEEMERALGAERCTFRYRYNTPEDAS